MSHPYATDSPERRVVPFALAAAAIGASFLMSGILKRYQIEAPWWATPPVDTMTLYGLFYWLFDRFIWKWNALRKLGVVRVPNLAGSWQGLVTPGDTTGVSAGLGAATEITLTIRQTWTAILIEGHTKLSNSHSVSASITVDDQTGIAYEYVNQPSSLAPGTMHSHRGFTRLLFHPALGTLEGDYYSGRDRQGFGSIRVRRSR